MFVRHLHGLHGLHRLHRLNRLHRLQRLHHLGHIADPVLQFTRGLAGRDPWTRRRGFRAARRGPSTLYLLLAGLAVFALVKVMSAAGRRRRFGAEKLVLGGLLLALAAVVMAFRRSSARYRL